MKNIEVVAHRGFSSVAPENTMLSFAKAIQAKVDMIELDVHLTSDQKMVVIHDETVDRTTTGTGWVKDLSLAEIKELTIRNHADLKVPTLAEVLTLIQNNHHVLNIELKTDQIDYKGIEQTVIGEVKRFGLEYRIIYSSFNRQTLKRLKELDPKSQIAVLFGVDDLPTQPWEAIAEMDADAIHTDYTSVRRDWVENCYRHNIQVRPYTVNDICDMKQLIELEVHGIITDDPDLLQ